MSDRPPDSSDTARTPPPITLAPEILDRYAGHYKLATYAVLTVMRDGNRLLSRTAFGIAELVPLNETEFVGSVTQSHYTFVTDAQGNVTGLTSNQDGLEVTWPRIDDAARDEMKAKLAARIESKTPVPGSDAALRRLIEGLRAGTPNYDEMSPALARACRRQLPQLQMTARFLGAIQSIEFQGVGSQGWDLYEVRRENGVVKWRIALTTESSSERPRSATDRNPRQKSASELLLGCATAGARGPAAGTAAAATTASAAEVHDLAAVRQRRAL